MNLYERLQLLVEQTNKSMNEIDRELGLPRNTLAGLKNHKPSISRLNIIADYFGVTTDYLLGNSDTPSEEIKNPRVRVLARHMDQEFTDEELDTLDRLLEEHFKNKKK
ncbi:helix-turn-helix transcriptional regulator [Lactococcus lactis]|jgi:transcriptional regulator with XRE-family HTH domain|uniref:Phage transcriptional regulator n=2 Tax=Lactococcus TaxID=1357 RepID=A0A0V8EDI7_LACLL|nr:MULTISPECIES: helix-turn-helix transcriptional regulator [Lactococcus]KEY62727.1 hypothetical protein U725_01120 [Lactococcus cremoris subsp. cremoris GE214]KSU23893.1 Phage transcriptional regulator [Lactococcus lactis subsp. lactis]MDU0409805.1 hypothetical protein [Lactococcus lactis]